MNADTRRLFCSTAIAYADLGFPVLPIWGVEDGRCRCGKRCRTPGKHPHGRFAPRGLSGATMDGGIICSWFTNECPNLGIRMGNGYLAIDVDPRNGGDETLLELDLPRTVTQQTGSGGRHFIYRTDEPIACGTNKLGQGIDVKGEGGYIIAAPSIHISGGVYKWLIDLRAGIAPLPSAIAARLVKPKEKSAISRNDAGDRDRVIAAGCLPLLSVARCADYDGWLRVGMACWRSGLSCEDWDQWSRTASEKYEEGTCEEKWPTFATRSDGVRSGSLVHWAAEDQGVTVAELLKRFDPAPVIISAKPRKNGMALYAERLRRIEAGQLESLPLPWAGLEELTRLGSPGRLTVIAGRQGAAKSFFALELLRYWLLCDVAAAAYLLEGDFGDLMDRSLAQASGISDVTDFGWQKANAETMRHLTEKYRGDLERVAGASTVSEGLGLETLEDMSAWIEAQAKAGKRAMVVDPITACVRTGQPWVSDPAFVRRVKRAARDYEATVILISHLVKGAEDGAVDKVAGSTAYSRFSDCVIQLTRHDDKKSVVRQACGRTELTHTHTLFVEKARAIGTGLKLAFTMTSGLTFQEHGIIARKDRS